MSNLKSKATLLGLLAACAAGWAAESPAKLFVSPSGNDANEGTEARPLRSLAAAQKAARKLVAAHAVTVLLRGGSYYLRAPLVLDPRDSGTTYTAYPGEVPVVSGGVRLRCVWRPFRDGILTCPVEPGLQFTQLFVDGKRQHRARYPNFDPQNPVQGGYADVVEGIGPPARGVRFSPDSFSKKRWASPKEAVIHIFPTTYWGNLQWVVDSVDSEKSILRFGWGGFQMKGGTSVGKGSKFYVENVLEELDAPGEWYLDAAKSVLYYMPSAGFDKARAVIEAPVLEQVIELRGTQDHPVRNVTISGLRIAHTRSTFLDVYEGPPSGDWTIHRGGAVFLEGSESCVIERCFFDSVGGNAVFVNNFNRKTKIQGNRITESGDSAICLMGTRDRIYGSSEAYPSGALVSNNLIHDCGVFGKQTAGVFISTSRGNTVSHNLIYNMPRAAILVNDGWSTGLVIEFNRIHDTVLETRDHGPFNSWGRDLLERARTIAEDSVNAVIVRNNWFKEDHGWGIDMDDVSSNYHVYNNLCIGMSVKLRQGYYRTVENNIFVNPANPPGFHAGFDDNGDRFLHNIIVTNSNVNVPEVDAAFRVGETQGASYQLIWPPAKQPWLKEIDYNIFYNNLGHFQASVRQHGKDQQKDVVETYSMAEWRNMGYDRHSVFADPLFVDPSKGDYRVKPGSLALALGFQNFDVGAAGLLPDFPARWNDRGSN